MGIAQHLTRRYVHQPRYLSHPNGARGLCAVLIVADDSEFDAITNRYTRILQVAPRREGPLTMLYAAAARLQFVRASDVEEVLPGEPVPASSYLAAMTILVDDVDDARKIVESNAQVMQIAFPGWDGGWDLTTEREAHASKIPAPHGRTPRSAPSETTPGPRRHR
ncbi:hypothetical protein NFX46_21010 [Streptomyces phaeoluteigriseus]|uniref:YCII-related domain-containing protein n=1 Tax=Streptomyces phaeoluteigriseus TaxID=114686 RepID=A0ABY4ZAJ0_9ACTN|nr:hypothetical protein [Streptomyces phaeoluteigriseus]USQ85981.1 hypothetical protein NFX46_21010 [Streptomyces phaeoluteigriseus]